MSVTARLNRLFADDGKCLNVAVDHGFFNEPSFLDGLRDVRSAITTLIKAGPDAIQLPPGSARHLQSVRGPRKPALVLRTDIANLYGPKHPGRLGSELIPDAVGTALRLDAACVVVNLFLIEDEPDLHLQCIRNVSQLRGECDRWGMPLMVEPLVMKASDRGRYGVDGRPERIVPLIRQAVELGADVIKADPTDDPDEFVAAIEVAGDIPVLARGGGKVSEAEIIARSARIMATGAGGLVYGRNIIQAPDPAGMVQRLMHVVHGNLMQAGPSA
jgi:DhnA family fructose-bisphosphate aldolase class Ia